MDPFGFKRMNHDSTNIHQDLNVRFPFLFPAGEFKRLLSKSAARKSINMRIVSAEREERRNDMTSRPTLRALSTLTEEPKGTASSVSGAMLSVSK